MLRDDGSSPELLIAPEMEFVDHRPLGIGSARGSERFMRGYRAGGALENTIAPRVEDVFEARPAALLFRSTTTGTDASGGGPFERELVRLWLFAPDGRLAREEWFDPGQEADALARFDAVSAGEAPRFENAATRAMGRHTEAWNAHDWERWAALFPPGFRYVDRRGIALLELEGAAHLDFMRETFTLRKSRLENEVLATRGDRLGLVRGRFEGEDQDRGPTEIEWLVVSEVDERSELAAFVRFDADALDAAYAELDARYERGEAASYARVWGMRRRGERAIAARDWEALAAAFAPGFVSEDHRSVGVWSLDSGADYLAGIRVLFDLAPDAVVRTYHVLGLDERRFLAVTGSTGTREGGAFELWAVTVESHGADGRIERLNLFGLDQLEQARARYAALAAEAPRIENLATRAGERGAAAWRAHDWAAFDLLLAPGHRSVDRRGIVQLELDREGWLASYRELRDMTTALPTPEVVATRGKRLALIRTHWTAAAGDVGPSVVEGLNVVETDEHGAQTLLLSFEPHDVDAAFEALDERFDAGEAAPFVQTRAARRRVGAAIAARDWDALAATFAPGFVSEDHRPAGVLHFGSGEEYVASVRSILELAPDAVLRTYHVLALGVRGGLSVTGWSGTREGGAFETNAVLVQSLAEDGRAQRFDMYSLDQLDAARTRYAELVAAAPRIENLATRAAERGADAWRAHDWAAYDALLAPGFRSIDRRGHVQLELDREGWLASYRELRDMTTALPTPEVVATRGQRLALIRTHWTAAAGDVGPSEIENLTVFETDENGVHTLVLGFDPHDLDAAFEALDERFDAGEAAPYARRPHRVEHAINAHDWEGVASSFAPEFVLEDHRQPAVFALRSGDEYVAVTRGLLEHAPDAILRVYHVLGVSEQSRLAIGGWEGTREGGPFEIVAANVTTWDAEGRTRRIDVYGLDQLDEARARFEGLRPDLLRIPPNAAWRQGDRAYAAATAGDWDAFRALYSPALVYEDRRRGIRLSGGLDLLMSTMRFGMQAGAHHTRTLLATAGESLSLERNLGSGSRPTEFEVEALLVREVDAEGRVVRGVVFDPDDRPAASRELFERWARASGVDPAVIERRRAVLYRDLEGLRALPAGFFLHDHRRAGAGRLEGDAHVAWLAALFEEFPDALIEPLYFLAVEPHGTLAVAHTFGTNRSGGAFESVYVQVFTSSAELFDLDDLDRARARLEELRPDPLRIPPNAAWRAHVRSIEVHRARDWAAMRALASPDFTFEDRGRKALVAGDVEMWVANASFIPPGSDGSGSELLGTAGERLALGRTLWRGEPGDGPLGREHLRLTELDAEGRTRAVLWFDLEDRAVAFEELHTRFVAGEAGGDPGQVVIAAIFRAFAQRDWTAWQRQLGADFVLDDRRTLGLGPLGIDDWLASLRVLVELAPDVAVEVLRILRWNRQGAVMMTRSFGTHEGGPFENPTLVIALTRGPRVRCYELFDVTEVERAFARFEELCGERAEP